MTCRIASSSPLTRRAIAGTVFPPAEAKITIAPAQTHCRAGASAHHLLKPLTLLISQAAHTNWFCHAASLTLKRSPSTNADRRVTNPANVHGQSTSRVAFLMGAGCRDRGKGAVGGVGVTG